MQKDFNSYIEKLPAILKMLLDMDPVIPSQLPKEMPTKGIYLFSDKGKYLYVGRSNNIRRRINHHCRLYTPNNQATFAFRMARERTTFKTVGTRKAIEADPVFNEAFLKAK